MTHDPAHRRDAVMDAAPGTARSRPSTNSVPRSHPAAGHLPPTITADPDQLAHRIRTLLGDADRFILGLTGPPGTGKSTLIAAIAAALAPLSVVIVPMDGFHLANVVIRETGRQHRKGAIDTFDAAGYALLLGRLRRHDESVVYAPTYVRALEEPIAAAVAVPRQARIVLTEGNYLLSPEPPWTSARAAMDQVWYLDTPHDLRIRRLVSRHIDHGKSPDTAAAWVSDSDEVNARAIADTRSRADLILAGA